MSGNDHHSPYYNIHTHSNRGSQPTTGWEKFKQKWKTIRQWTFGNRRLKMYIYSVLKMFTITYIQANSIIGVINKTTKQQFEKDLQQALQIISYFYMATLIILFTVRYVRELIALKRKKPLTIWINWLEAFIFMTYFVYSCFTAILHIVYIGKKYSAEAEERKEHPEEFAHHSVSLEQELIVEILEVIIHMYIIGDKGSHFLHAGHSVSLYLAKAQHIPKNAHPGHGHGGDSHHHGGHGDEHNDYQHDSKAKKEEEEEKDNDDYDDYVGKTTSSSHHGGGVVTSSNDGTSQSVHRRNTNFGQERLIDPNNDL